jgi:hypothetical protein
MKSNRVYYHYEQLEEFHAGMWRIIRGEMRKAYVQSAANLMRDAQAFKDAMLRAIREWPKSCEFNFTSDAVNRIAWLGHAGCCIGVQSPEEATRCGWHTLNQSEQDEANRVAAEVLAIWDDERNPIRVVQMELFHA